MDKSKDTTNNNSVEALQEENLKLKKKLEALKQKNLVQQDFISRMSHDIRSPLNAVMGFAALIKEHSFNAQKVHNEAEKIIKSGNYMLGIINDVLDLSKIESGTIVLKNSEFNIESCVNDVKEMIITQMHSKYQKFSISIDKLEYPVVLADENYIKQILLNLLSNSCKYTGEGGNIELIVSNKAASTCGYTDVTFIVKDNGRGMSEEFQKTIFTPFGREQQEGVPDPGGTGLGLVLIKNMICMMGGTISFESKMGVGTTFTIVIPMMIVGEVSCALDERPPKEEVDSKDIFKGLNILAAEDNELNSELLSEILISRGAIVSIEADGQKVVDRFLAEPVNTYDLILMDIMMPRMNGYEATENIRNCSREDAASIPIIAMTANAFDEDIKKALDAGMNAHIAKPINITNLEKTAARILRS